MTFTEYEIEELKKCYEDPIYFITKHIRVQHLSKGSIPLIDSISPAQEHLLKNIHEERFNVVLKARQTGVTSIIAAYILWCSLFSYDQRIGLFDHKHAASKDTLHRIMFMYDSLPPFMRVECSRRNKTEFGFVNGSTIYALSANPCSTRGRTFSLVFFDEFGFLPTTTQEEMWSTIMPVLSGSKDSKCIVASSGTLITDSRSTFAELWRRSLDDETGFKPTLIRWTSLANRDIRFKNEMITLIGTDQWEAEYEPEIKLGAPRWNVKAMLDTNPVVHCPYIPLGINDTQPLQELTAVDLTNSEASYQEFLSKLFNK